MNLKMTSFSGFFLALVLFVSPSIAIAQIHSYGNMIIENQGDMKVYTSWNFLENNLNSNLGIKGTERSGSRGFITFMNGASVLNANNNGFIDGYVRSELSSPFIFPIGDNSLYRPIAISGASGTEPIDAAYFLSNPSVAKTSPFFGSSNAVLPSDGPYNTSLKESVISSVSSKEYWDINGTSSTKISLTWTPASDINGLSFGNLNYLTILGWNGSQWIKIPSKIDAFSVLGPVSNMNSGSITTSSSISPNSFSVYTLGSTLPETKQVFSSRTKISYTYQNDLIQVNLPLTSAFLDSNLIIQVTHESQKLGTLPTSTNEQYSYRADNEKIGIDSVYSIANIYNKPTGTFTYDTFLNEIFVRYKKTPTFINLGTNTEINLGKKILNPQNLTTSYSFEKKWGTILNYNQGTFRYQSNAANVTDTLLFILTADYRGRLNTVDTAIYRLKLNQAHSGINLAASEHNIPNFITPNQDGMNDNWILPVSIASRSDLSISIFNIQGAKVYGHSGPYLQDWDGSTLNQGIYLYQIQTKSDQWSGMIKVEK